MTEKIVSFWRCENCGKRHFGERPPECARCGDKNLVLYDKHVEETTPPQKDR